MAVLHNLRVTLEIEQVAAEARKYQDLSLEALEVGDRAAYNAANEVAVHAFLQEKISFGGIMECVESVVQKLGGGAPVKLRDLADVSAIEDDARRYAHEYVD